MNQMIEPLFSFKPNTYEHVSEIAVGMKIPVHAETKGKCENCGDMSGLLYYYEVLNGGRLVHWFTDNHGGIKQHFACLRTEPCSSCRPNQPIPTIKLGEEPEWWD